MKRIILVVSAVTIVFGAFAQTDSSMNRMSPPDINDNSSINSTVDTMDHNQEVKFNNNQEINNSPTQTMNKNTQTDVRINPGDSKPQAGFAVKQDYIMMQNSKLWEMKNGTKTLMNADVVLNNGTKIRSDGTVTKKDGSQTKMKEGQRMDMSGNSMIQQHTNSKTTNSVQHIKKTSVVTNRRASKNMYVVPDSTVKKGGLK